MSDAATMTDSGEEQTLAPAHSPTPTTHEVQRWVTGYIAHLLGFEEDSIDHTCTFDEIGLDSMMVIVMTEELGRRLGREIDPTSAYDYPTIETFAARVSAAT